jgi:tripartite-type tricarboxylate transporter receptor subunit TctC
VAYIDRTRSLGLIPVSSTPAEFSAYVAAEIERYRKQLLPLGISMD